MEIGSEMVAALFMQGSMAVRFGLPIGRTNATAGPAHSFHRTERRADHPSRHGAYF
jgi:hypothetical protein